MIYIRKVGSRILKVPSAGVSAGRWRFTAYIGFSEFGEEVEIIFLLVGFHN
jgi:hypothetical protein